MLSFVKHTSTVSVVQNIGFRDTITNFSSKNKRVKENSEVLKKFQMKNVVSIERFRECGVNPFPAKVKAVNIPTLDLQALTIRQDFIRMSKTQEQSKSC